MQILQGVVHPTHVPLEAESQTTGVGRRGDAWVSRGFLGDHHDARIVLVCRGVGFLEEVDGFEILAAAVDVRMPLAGLTAVVQVQHRGDRVHTKRVDMELIQPEAGVGHQEVRTSRRPKLNTYVPQSGCSPRVDPDPHTTACRRSGPVRTHPSGSGPEPNP